METFLWILCGALAIGGYLQVGLLIGRTAVKCRDENDLSSPETFLLYPIACFTGDGVAWPERKLTQLENEGGWKKDVWIGGRDAGMTSGLWQAFWLPRLLANVVPVLVILVIFRTRRRISKCEPDARDDVAALYEKRRRTTGEIGMLIARRKRIDDAIGDRRRTVEAVVETEQLAAGEDDEIEIVEEPTVQTQARS